MDTHEIPERQPSLWRRESSEVITLLLGKIGEEASELGGAVCRAVIQGLGEREPVTGKSNLSAIEDELADVHALYMVAIDRLPNLSATRMYNRAQGKAAFLQRWLDGVADLLAAEAFTPDPATIAARSALQKARAYLVDHMEAQPNDETRADLAAVDAAIKGAR